MVNKRLKELKNELDEIASCGGDAYVSVGLSTKFATINNVVKADEILFLENEIDIQSDHFNLNLNLTCDTNIIKYDYGIESEYHIKNDDMELYINLMGA